jgi:hypothetical protein
MIIQRITAALFAAGLFATPGVWAQGPIVTGDYSIYYSAITSETLDPDVAKVYGIQRSNRAGLLNVSVMKTQPDGPSRNVPAQVEASGRTGQGPKGLIAMREIRVGDGISYVGQFPIENEQIVDFEIQVTPPAAPEPTMIELQEQFFVD